MSGAPEDLELLRRYEPVVCYTRGEQFFPTAVDGYLRRASLWVSTSGETPRRLVDEGRLDAPGLVAAVQSVPAGRCYLRFTDRPVDGAAYRRWLQQRASFRAPGRLTRVGLGSRIIDAFFDASFLLRGRVPGGATAIAAEKYRAMQAEDGRHVYYGRVVRVGGYVVLNYWFFYAMNPWRSGYFGANDHEADWEQVLVYLSDEADGAPVPRWVAYAQHDFAGDDLRRRWDDPELRRDGDHPVVYAGAGSHASYFEPGEYLMGVEPAVLSPVRSALEGARRFWTERLGQGLSQRDGGGEGIGPLVAVPFVDYARGDGTRIGPGQAHAWTPVLLRDEPGWVEVYRGLWGLDTRDPFGGERAPSGPRYNRDGSVRFSWYDPLGWAGLDKVGPKGATPADLRLAVQGLEEEREALGAQIERQRSALRRQALVLRAVGPADAPAGAAVRQAELDLQALTRRASDLDERLGASRAWLVTLAAGDPGDPQAHIRRKHRPEAPLTGRAPLVELWGALSAGVLMATLGALVVLEPVGWPLWVLVAIGVAVVVEAAAQRRLIAVLLNVTIVLAVATLAVLVKDFWQVAVILALLVFLVSLIAQNLGELRRA